MTYHSLPQKHHIDTLSIAEEKLCILLQNKAVVWSKPGSPFLSPSGKQWDFLIDARRVFLDHEGARLCAIAFASLLQHFKASLVVGEGLGAYPLVQLLVDFSPSKLSGLLIRKEAKKWGLHEEIEGEYKLGESVVLIDDVINTGSAARRALETLHKHGLRVEGAIFLISFSPGKGVEGLRKVLPRAINIFECGKDGKLRLANSGTQSTMSGSR